MVSSLNLMVLWIITVCCCSGAVGHYCHLYYGVWNSSSFPKTAVIFSHFTGLICCVSVSVIKSVFFFLSLICICSVLRLQTEKKETAEQLTQAPVKGWWEVPWELARGSALFTVEGHVLTPSYDPIGGYFLHCISYEGRPQLTVSWGKELTERSGSGSYMCT